MKKAIVLLLALTVLGGAVFAQATVNGYVRAKADISDEGTAALVTRVRLNLSYTTEDKNAYAFVRLQTSDYLAPTVAYAYGRVTLLDGMVKVYGGKLANYDYTLGSGVSEYLLGNVSNDGYALDSVKGMLFQVLPIEGLNIGAAFFPDATFDLNDLDLNASYSIAGIGDVVLTSSLDAVIADTVFSGSFKLTAVEGLSAIVGYKSAGSVYGIIDYSVAGFDLQVAPEFVFDGSSIYVEGCVSYPVADTGLTLNVVGAYDQGGATLGTDATKVSYALNTKTGVVDMTAAKAAVTNNYLFGLEVLYKISAKGLLQTGVTYDQANGLSVPLVVKVSF